MMIIIMININDNSNDTSNSKTGAPFSPPRAGRSPGSGRASREPQGTFAETFATDKNPN